AHWPVRNMVDRTPFARSMSMIGTVYCGRVTPASKVIARRGVSDGPRPISRSITGAPGRATGAGTRARAAAAEERAGGAGVGAGVDEAAGTAGAEIGMGATTGPAPEAGAGVAAQVIPRTRATMQPTRLDGSIALPVAGWGCPGEGWTAFTRAAPARAWK